jgi:hypothetical protein
MIEFDDRWQSLEEFGADYGLFPIPGQPAKFVDASQVCRKHLDPKTYYAEQVN